MNRHTSIAGSLGSALRGFSHGRGSRNLKIIIVIILVVGAAALALPLTTQNRLILAITILAVLAAELFNTSIEELCDVITTQHHPGIARVKELASAAVFAVSIAAIIVGLYIFLPYFI